MISVGYILIIVRNHLQFYSTPTNINNVWNMGFLLYISITIQIVTGLLLSTNYSPTQHSYQSIQTTVREFYYGWYLSSLHSTGASIVFGAVIVHIGRGLYVSSYLYRTSLWISGLVLYLLLMIIGFMGYILAWGQLSFWAGTVICNIFKPMNLLLLVTGWSLLTETTLHRFFVFHFLLPLLLLVLSWIHIFYLHHITSSNTLSFYTYNLITFYPVILWKDILGLISLGIGYGLQIFNSYGLSHPDNILEVNTLVTPLHICPEWYFLSMYIVLKSIPNKTSGLYIVILTLSHWLLNQELGTLVISGLSTSINWIYGNHLIIVHGLQFLVLSFIGSQLPQNTFLTHGRTVTILNNLILWSSLT